VPIAFCQLVITIGGEKKRKKEVTFGRILMKALFRQGTKAPLFFMIEKRAEGAPFK
jgi:hypothetical protein